jgi:glycosyltransferase involved in cell wall biosynthesis
MKFLVKARAAMNDLLRFSIVTPSYNTGRHIADAIRSVLSQEYPNLDYLVMDGASTDDTVEVLRSFGDRIRWVSMKDGGQSDAIAKGFTQTSGQILAWLNADDVLAPGALQTVAEFFAATPDVDLVYGDATYIDAGGKEIGRCVHVEPFSSKRLSRYSDFIVQPAAFFRRSAYDAVGGLDPNLHYGMDYDLWLKLARAHKIVYLPKRLASYRWLTDNKTAAGGFRRLDELRELTARHGLDEPAFLRLERINLLIRESFRSLRTGSMRRSILSAGHALGTFVTSPRAMRSMLQPHTWRIIWMGQVLREGAARAQRRCNREPDEPFTPARV